MYVVLLSVPSHFHSKEAPSPTYRPFICRRSGYSSTDEKPSVAKQHQNSSIIASKQHCLKILRAVIAVSQLLQSNTMCRKDSSHERLPFLIDAQGSAASTSRLTVQMKMHVESKKRRLSMHRLARSARENIVVFGFTCLFLVCLMFGFHLGQMLADYDEDGARTLTEPQRTELTNQTQKTSNTDALEVYNLSPYERHWPRFSVDPWMRKIVKRYPPKEKEVCLVHIGKV
jgi:hypothetical protein